MSKKSKKKNRTLDIIILMMQMISLIANLWLLKHAIDRSIVKKKRKSRHENAPLSHTSGKERAAQA
jgi:hypothetical protein